MHEDLSSIQDAQRQLLATVTKMGETLDALVNTELLASSSIVDDRVVDSVFSRIGARGLSPLLEKDEEDEDWFGKGIPDLGQKTTLVKALSSGTFGGSLISEGHHDVSLPKVTNFGTLGRPNTFGETSTSKRTSKVPLGNRTDSPESGISSGVEPVGLHVG